MRSRSFLFGFVGVCLVGLFGFVTTNRNELCALFLYRDFSRVQRALSDTVAREFALSLAAAHPLEQNHEASGPGRPAAYLSNTILPFSALLRRESAILLRNASIDTAETRPLEIPEVLRSDSDPGAYLVQTHPPDLHLLVRHLADLGAQPVSYIPNNSWLVRAPSDVGRQIRRLPEVTAMVAFEPWFKLNREVLEWALERAGQTEPQQDFRVLVFGSPAADRRVVDRVPGVQVLGAEPSPFGELLRVRATGDARPALIALARLPEVLSIERATRRIPANDLSRVTMGISPDTYATTNWLGLTGSNVLVHLSDTGVDAGHPDLAGRIIADGAVPGSDMDTAGHGTHVAGIIAGSGLQSQTVVHAPGSLQPSVAGQFRGTAPGAHILSTAALGDAQISDTSLQRVAATSNAVIAVHSWYYESHDYDASASSYDAAARDALPELRGEQPILPVFAGAGFDWLGNSGDTGPAAAAVHSPGTAKNGITVGALENARWITNTVWYTVSTNGGSYTTTNQPWLDMTDSGDAVWSASPSANVDVGTEGAVGRMKPDVVAPGAFVVSARSRQWDAAAYYSALSSSPGDAALVLSNLNHELGPQYRFESGSSMAAARVAGVLALLQEFLVRKTGALPSPALLKAFLINGARPVNAPPPNPGAPRNAQGWGCPELPFTLPSALQRTNADGPVVFVEQSPALSLSTGQRRTWNLAVSSSARAAGLRMTLVWTDPPANPVAGVKLVNNLDLLVTNLDSGDVFKGNSLDGTGFSAPGAGTDADCINNVENIFLPAGPGGRYSVTVSASQVNVAAAAGPPDVVAQDFALVLSTEAVEDPEALVLGPPVLRSDVPTPIVEALTNSSAAPGLCAWTVLKGIKLGAHAPWPGTNQVLLPANQGVLTIGDPAAWRVYTFTNQAACTNLAVTTFQARRQGQIFPGTNGNTEADVDLYVSTNAGLAVLEPGALAEAWTSLHRGGSETVVLTNADPVLYYIATKSESQAGAEFSILAAVSELPFAEEDTGGKLVLRGLPVEVAIPDRMGAGPGTLQLLALSPDVGPVRRVVVSNVVTHARHSDLRSTLSHGDRTVTLKLPAGAANGGTKDYVFDDSLEGDIPDAISTSGPGSLTDFAGQDAGGQWLFTQTDEVAGSSGTNNSFCLLLDPQRDLRDGVSMTVRSGATALQTVQVPVGATNLELSVNSGMGEGHAVLGLRRVGESVSNTVSLDFRDVPPEPALTSSKYSLPPLNPGLYYVTVRNDHPELLWLDLRARIDVAPEPQPAYTYSFAGPAVIPDQRLSSFPLNVAAQGRVAAATVGLRIDHPRVSDLAFRLVSPRGTAVVLAENRGGASSEGLGLDSIVTNTVPVDANGGAEAYTNRMTVGTGPGAVLIVYSFYTLPDRMHVYRGSNLLWDSGLTGGSDLQKEISYDSDPSGTLTIVMNEGDNYDPNTSWHYAVTSTRVGIVHAVFAENAEFAPTLIKFVAPPFTNSATAEPLLTTNSPFFRPEESLQAFVGEPVAGTWTLEVLDRTEGGVIPVPMLNGWELQFVLEDSVPLPVVLSHGVPHSTVIPAGYSRPYSISVPAWAHFATNQLLSASGPVQIWYSAAMPPTGTNEGDQFLLFSSNPGAVTLSAASVPKLVPNQTYYISLVNTGSQDIATVFRTDFDVVPLARNTNRELSLPAGALPLYFSLLVPTNVAAFQLQLTNLNGNLDLLLSKSPRLPTLDYADYRSDNPGGEPEQILITADSMPVPLEPGTWYAAVYNSSDAASTGTLIHSEAASPLTLFASAPSPPSVQLDWQGPPGFEYEVQWSAALESPSWVAFPGTVTSADGWFSFVDDGSATGGLGQTRYYRVLQVRPAW